MFTGLIETKGEIAGVEKKGSSRRLFILPEAGDYELREGDSVTVDGLCLTVAGFKDKGFIVEVSSESLARSTLGDIRLGSFVNLERALRVGDRLGGHMVQGHVDGTGKITSIKKEGDFIRLGISASGDLMRYIVEKGSVAVDGISLTVNEKNTQGFSLMLIPETLKRTTLGLKREGDRVNIETDIIAKYIESLLSSGKGVKAGITLEKLKDEGFL